MGGRGREIEIEGERARERERILVSLREVPMSEWQWAE